MAQKKGYKRDPKKIEFFGICLSTPNPWWTKLRKRTSLNSTSPTNQGTISTLMYHQTLELEPMLNVQIKFLHLINHDLPNLMNAAPQMPSFSKRKKLIKVRFPDIKKNTSTESMQYNCLDSSNMFNFSNHFRASSSFLKPFTSTLIA